MIIGKPQPPCDDLPTAALRRPRSADRRRRGLALDGLTCGAPVHRMADVVAAAKKPLRAGDVFDGEGGYTVYGLLENSAAVARRPGADRPHARGDDPARHPAGRPAHLGRHRTPRVVRARPAAGAGLQQIDAATRWRRVGLKTTATQTAAADGRLRAGGTDAAARRRPTGRRRSPAHRRPWRRCARAGPRTSLGYAPIASECAIAAPPRTPPPARIAVWQKFQWFRPVGLTRPPPRRPPHVRGDHHQRRIEQPPLVEVREQCGDGSVEDRQQVLAQRRKLSTWQSQL